MKKIFLYILLLLISFCAFTHPGAVFAQESIHNFDVTLSAHKDGSMSISENILYDFGNSVKHGIYRSLPLVSRVGNLYRVISLNVVSIARDGNSEHFEISKDNNTLQIKIGDPNLTITGLHNYKISYDVQNGMGSNYADHDEIYWNVTGNSWNVPIQTASLLMQTDFLTKPGKTICYTGVAGAKDTSCTVEDTSNGKKIVLTLPLSSGEGLTVVSSFPVNTFPRSILQQQSPGSSANMNVIIFLIILFLLLNFLLAPWLLYWYFKFKHKKRFGPVTVNFDIPEYPAGNRIIPAEAGTIDNTKLDKGDLTATFFDLATRKYIQIEQVQEKSGILGMGTKNDYRLIKLKSFEDLGEFEKQFTQAVFGREKSVLLSGILLNYADYTDLKIANFKSLKKRGFYTKNPETQKGILLGLGILFTVTLSFVLGPVLIFLSRKLNCRTDLGDEMDWKIDGLKLFLRNMSREYKWQAEKAYVVEKMIPYAMALGCINEFMDQLKILKPDYQPSWYVGRGAFWGMYPSFSTTFNSNIAIAAPSSSGFSSGGFSGGGGGGGGGGSW